MLVRGCHPPGSYLLDQQYTALCMVLPPVDRAAATRGLRPGLAVDRPKCCSGTPSPRQLVLIISDMVCRVASQANTTCVTDYGLTGKGVQE